MLSDSHEDSLTLDGYLLITKKEVAKEKRARKEAKRERKSSTQLSIFGWLNQGKLGQHSLLISLDRELILKIYSYMRLSETMLAAQVCAYFWACYRTIWTDRSFFGDLETDKFTSMELGKLISKSSRLSHLRQLKSIYSGKNISYCREKIKLRLSEDQAQGSMLSIFAVTPKTSWIGFTFITDKHLLEVVTSSHRSLKVVQLAKCAYIKDFSPLATCHQLTQLAITSTEYMNTEMLGEITRGCRLLESLHLESCYRLEETIFEYIKDLPVLRQLLLRDYRQGFGKLSLLERNSCLTDLDLEGSMIIDEEAIFLLKFKALKALSCKNCKLLTDIFACAIIQSIQKTSLEFVDLLNSGVSEGKLQELQLLIRK